ncbi:MAG: alpha-ketoglutarate-dependent dioxygenase AlkB [Bauldia sp.]
MRYFPGFLDAGDRLQLLGEVRSALEAAPPFTPTMPRTGKPFSVRMTNLGTLGWVSDRSGGYRYQTTHPVTGQAWPPIPDFLTAIWRKLADYPHLPEACLINLYSEKARMGLHRDADEDDFAAPVLSVSLGAEALFRIGGRERGDPTRSFRLKSGDVLLLAGETRLAYHGVDRIYPGTSSLPDGAFPGIARVNLTLRRVRRPS